MGFFSTMFGRKKTLGPDGHAVVGEHNSLWDGNFEMKIEDIMPSKAIRLDTAVTGKYKSGTVKAGDTVTIYDSTGHILVTMVRVVESFIADPHRKSNNSAVALILEGVEKAGIEPGCLLRRD